MKINTCSYRSIIRSSGLFDIVIMLPFAIPGVVAWTMAQLQTIHNSLFLSGTLPDFSPFHLFFINIMALVSIVWSVLRIQNPMPRYAAYDTVARILIAAVMLIYLLYYNVSELLWLFFIAEITWAALQINGHLNKSRIQNELLETAT